MTNNSTVQSIVSEEPKKAWYVRFFGAVKEWFRKQIVGIKKRPHKIPLLFQVVTLLVYSFNLTDIAGTAVFANVGNMGLYCFVIMLAEILILVMFLNAFPKRQKPKTVMIALTFVTMAIIILCCVLFAIGIEIPFVREEQQIDFETVNDAMKAAITTARKVIRADIILQAVTMLLLATLPLYSKLLQKIDTSVKLDEGPTLSVVEKEDDE
jgi:hypothetical protein